MKVSRIIRDGHPIWQITDHHHLVEILPDCGAIINRWVYKTGKGMHDIIQGYASPEDFSGNFAEKGFRSCKLSPYACRIRNSTFIFEGNKYSIGKFGYDRHNIHGLLFDASYKVLHHYSGPEQGRIELATQYKGDDPGFPFPYSVNLIYELNRSNELSITTKIKNTGDKKMPVCDGWHPYFSISDVIDDCYLTINAERSAEFDTEMIPTSAFLELNEFRDEKQIGPAVFDNCFPIKDKTLSACVLSNKATGLSLKIDALQNYDYLQLFTPPDRGSIAIEMLSAMPDAFNNGIGLRHLEPTEDIEFICRYTLF